MCEGDLKILHIRFIPPKSEKGIKNHIPKCINLSVSEDIINVSLVLEEILNKILIRKEYKTVNIVPSIIKI